MKGMQIQTECWSSRVKTGNMAASISVAMGRLGRFAAPRLSETFLTVRSSSVTRTSKFSAIARRPHSACVFGSKNPGRKGDNLLPSFLSNPDHTGISSSAVLKINASDKTTKINNERTNSCTNLKSAIESHSAENSIPNSKEMVVKRTGDREDDGLFDDKDFNPNPPGAMQVTENVQYMVFEQTGKKIDTITNHIPDNYPDTLLGSNVKSATVKRTVDINLNELVKAPDKTKLSMDINVVVSLKPPDNNGEIGFHGTLSAKKQIAEKATKKVPSNEIVEEVGKIYNFLKNNGRLQNYTCSTNFNVSSNEAVEKFEKVKKLYFNAVNCVKSFKDLTNRLNAMRKKSDSTTCRNLPNKTETPNDLGGLHNVKHLGYKGVDTQTHGKPFLSAMGPHLMKVRMSSTDSGTKKSDCLKAKKLPCLEPSDIPGAKKVETNKGVCEKMCMPCCRPARDPPICFHPYHKPPCKKLKAPRPAFSECKMLFELKQIKPCECYKPRATSCKKSADSEKCGRN